MAFAISSGLSPQAGHLLRHRRRVPDLGARRLASARSAGRPARSWSWSSAIVAAARRRRPVHVHDDGRRHARRPRARPGMGAAVQFIPRPVVVGFTNGIAVLIASTQIKDFFGLQIDDVPGEFVERMEALALTRSTRSSPGHGPGRRRAARDRRALRPLREARARRRSSPCWSARWSCASVGLRSRPSAPGSAASPAGCPRCTSRRSSRGLILQLLSPALTVALLGAHRVADVRRRRRPHERRQAQPERRTGRRRASPTSCRRSSAACRRPAPSRARPPTSASGAKTPVSRDDPRAHAAGGPAVRRAARAAHPARRARRDPVRGRLQHGRVARDSRSCSS